MAIQSTRFLKSRALNGDMLMEILLRLPAKSLAKFKSVSSDWNSLISSRYFSRRHTLLHPTSSASALILRSSADSYYRLSLSHEKSTLSPLPLLPCPAGVRILQSCNGLLLCRSVAGNTVGPRDYYVYNPATRDLKLLPSFPSGRPFPTLGVTLAFDPSKPEEYNVVGVGSVGQSGTQYHIVVYSSTTGCWKEWSGSDFYVAYEVVFSNGVYWNGAVHWIAAANRNDSLYFDVANERLGKMPSPPISTRSGLGTFAELDGKLSYVDANEGAYKVYAMEKYNNAGWSIRHEVEIGEIARGLPEKVADNYAEWMLCLAREEGNGRLVALIHVPGKILVYDLVDKSNKKLCDCEVEIREGDVCGKLQFSGFDAYTYAPTLAYVTH